MNWNLCYIRIDMKILPIFKYYDPSENMLRDPLSKFEYGRIVQQLYVFSKEKDSKEIVLKNIATDVEEVVTLNLHNLKKYLVKENLIN